MKMKPYENYKQTNLRWLNKIPCHWETYKVKYKFKLVQEPSYNKKPVVLSLTQRGIVIRDIETNTGQIAKSYEGYNTVRKGDISLNPMDLESGAASISKYNGVISNAYFTIRPKEKDINTKFYSLYFNMHYHKRLFYPFGKGVGRPEGSGGRWSLNRNTFRNFNIIVPPKNEQDLIVDFLDDKLEKIDKFIDLKTRQIELLKEQKEAMINKAVTIGIKDNVKMKDSRIDLAKKIPMNWEIMPLKRIFNVKNGNGFPIELQGKIQGKYPFLKVSDINSLNIYVDFAANYLEEIDVKNEGYGIVPKNSIIIAKIGEALKKNHRKINNVDCLIDNNLQALLPIRNDQNQIKYLYYLMKIIDMNWFDNAGTVPSINNRKLMAFKVPLAPKMEQNRIVEFIKVESEKIDQTIILYKKEIELIKEYKMSLISSAVTGKIDLQDFKGGELNV